MSNIELKTDEEMQSIVIQMSYDNVCLMFNQKSWDNLDTIKNCLQILEEIKKKKENGFEPNKLLMSSLLPLL